MFDKDACFMSTTLFSIADIIVKDQLILSQIKEILYQVRNYLYLSVKSGDKLSNNHESFIVIDSYNFFGKYESQGFQSSETQLRTRIRAQVASKFEFDFLLLKKCWFIVQLGRNLECLSWRSSENECVRYPKFSTFLNLWCIHKIEFENEYF